MKKTGQPLSFSMSDVTEGVVELWNRNHYTNASRYAIRWELKEDDKVIQSATWHSQQRRLAKSWCTYLIRSQP